MGCLRLKIGSGSTMADHAPASQVGLVYLQYLGAASVCAGVLRCKSAGRNSFFLIFDVYRQAGRDSRTLLPPSGICISGGGLKVLNALIELLVSLVGREST